VAAAELLRSPKTYDLAAIRYLHSRMPEIMSRLLNEGNCPLIHSLSAPPCKATVSLVGGGVSRIAFKVELYDETDRSLAVFSVRATYPGARLPLQSEHVAFDSFVGAHYRDVDVFKEHFVAPLKTITDVPDRQSRAHLLQALAESSMKRAAFEQSPVFAVQIFPWVEGVDLEKKGRDIQPDKLKEAVRIVRNVTAAIVGGFRAVTSEDGALRGNVLPERGLLYDTYPHNIIIQEESPSLSPRVRFIDPSTAPGFAPKVDVLLAINSALLPFDSLGRSSKASRDLQNAVREGIISAAGQEGLQELQDLGRQRVLDYVQAVGRSQGVWTRLVAPLISFAELGR
jgi:hypothetical protein